MNVYGRLNPKLATSLEDIKDELPDAAIQNSEFDPRIFELDATQPIASCRAYKEAKVNNILKDTFVIFRIYLCIFA
jgi:hypothetical protein